MKLTPHQRLVRAAIRGTGLRLDFDEVFTLGGMDDAIITRASVDCEHQGIDSDYFHTRGAARKLAPLDPQPKDQPNE